MDTIEFDVDAMVTDMVEFGDQIWIGRLDGLFRLDRRTLKLESFEAESLGNRPHIVGMTKTQGGELLWIATRSNGVFTLGKSGGPVRVQEIDVGLIRSITTDPEGQIWIASDDGFATYKPTSRAPSLYVTTDIGEKEYRVRWDQPIEVFASSRDDSKSVVYRYRVDGQEWQPFNSVTPQQLSLHVPEEGRHVLEIVDHLGCNLSRFQVPRRLADLWESTVGISMENWDSPVSINTNLKSISAHFENIRLLSNSIQNGERIFIVYLVDSLAAI